MQIINVIEGPNGWTEGIGTNDVSTLVRMGIISNDRTLIRNDGSIERHFVPGRYSNFSVDGSYRALADAEDRDPSLVKQYRG